MATMTTFCVILSLKTRSIVHFLDDLRDSTIRQLLAGLLPAICIYTLLFMFFLMMFTGGCRLRYHDQRLKLCLVFNVAGAQLFARVVARKLVASLITLLNKLVYNNFLSRIVDLTATHLIKRNIVTRRSDFSLDTIFFAVLKFLVVRYITLFVLYKGLFGGRIRRLLCKRVKGGRRANDARKDLLSLMVNATILLITC